MIEIVFPGIIVDALIGRAKPECRCDCWDRGSREGENCSAGSYCSARMDIGQFDAFAV